MPIGDIYINPRNLADGTKRYHYSTCRGPTGVKFWTTDGYRLDMTAKNLPVDFVRAYVKACEKEEERPSPSSFGELLKRYRAKSARFKRMKPKSQKTRLKYLYQWADMPMKNEKPASRAPIRAFEQLEIIPILTDYRDDIWGHSPSAAEEAQIALSAYLRWCRSEGHIKDNLASALESPYERPEKANTWEKWQLDLQFSKSSEPIQHFIELALFTGLRLSDLVKLTTKAIKPQHIIIPTDKSGATAIVPIVPEMRSLLERIDAFKRQFKTTSLTILVNTYGTSWTADGLSTSFYNARKKVDLGEPRPTIHDLRKTSATRMVILQHRYPDVITDAVLMEMFTWTPGTLRKMKRIYVNDDEVIAAITGRK